MWHPGETRDPSKHASSRQQNVALNYLQAPLLALGTTEGERSASGASIRRVKGYQEGYLESLFLSHPGSIPI